jgi:hypothetical protein
LDLEMMLKMSWSLLRSTVSKPVGGHKWTQQGSSVIWITLVKYLNIITYV